MKRKSRKADNPLSRRDVGAAGERAAARLLKRKKYKIVGTNIHAGHSELDIIAVKGETLVFVEVKTRLQRSASPQNLTRPADAVNKSKRTYLIRGANLFCRQNAAKYGALCKRFDIIEVYYSESNGKIRLTEIKHFENAL